MRRFHALSPVSQGIVLMLGAIFLFSLMDASVKGISQRADPVQALWARYLGQTVIVGAICARNLRSTLTTSMPGIQILRSVLILGATAFFFFGISRIGLMQATSVLNLSPVLTTLGAALILGERLGIRRTIGVLAALLGALIVIRPGVSVFSVYSLLPLGAAVCLSGFTIATRYVGLRDGVWTSLLYSGLVGSVIMTLLVPFFWVRPDAVAWALLGAISVIGALAQLLMIGALRRAEASQIAPFTYASLVYAAIWGRLFFGETPDAATLLGALVIVGAGIYVWHRETRAAG